MGFLPTEPSFQQIPLLNRGQQTLHSQLLRAAQMPGAGGAFGTAADFYRDLLSDDSKAFDAFAAPEMRQFQQDIIPGLSEQFAGMGSGGLTSSGFRNAAVSAGTDLQERLGSIRAQLRQQGAQGLASLAQQGLQPVTQTVGIPGSQGFAAPILQGLGTGLGAAVGGPAGAAVGGAVGGGFGSLFNRNTSPYGGIGANPTPQTSQFNF